MNETDELSGVNELNMANEIEKFTKNKRMEDSKIAIIFDFDGTISDSLGNLHEFFKHSSRLFNKTYPHITKNELKQNFLEPFTELYLSFGFNWNDESDILTKEFEAFMIKKHAPIFEGIPKLLADLSKISKVGIATDSRIKIIEERIDNYNIGSFISAYSAAEEVGKFKPSPEVIVLCMKKLESTPENTFYVGDQTCDIDAARRAGCKVISVAWGFISREKLAEKNPDFIVETPEEILKIVEDEMKSKRDA